MAALRPPSNLNCCSFELTTEDRAADLQNFWRFRDCNYFVTRSCFTKNFNANGEKAVNLKTNYRPFASYFEPRVEHRFALVASVTS